jgi:hypothetical protein
MRKTWQDKTWQDKTWQDKTWQERYRSCRMRSISFEDDVSEDLNPRIASEGFQDCAVGVKP